MLWVYVVFVAFSWGETFSVAAAFLSVTYPGGPEQPDRSRSSMPGMQARRQKQNNATQDCNLFKGVRTYKLHWPLSVWEGHSYPVSIYRILIENPIQINLFGEESGQRRNSESQAQGREKRVKVKGSDLERVILTLAFWMGEGPKAWLRHDFLMLRSQAGKAKGVT